jgi:hypothetical protein
MVTDAVKGEKIYITFSNYDMQGFRWVPVLEVIDGGYIVNLDGLEAIVKYENVLQRPLRESEKPKPPPPPPPKTREELINEHVKGVVFISKETYQKYVDEQAVKEKEESAEDVDKKEIVEETAKEETETRHERFRERKNHA